MKLLKSINRLMRSNSNETQQFQGHYIEWRAKRLAAIIDYYKPGFFLGKTVLEVGCGHGDIGGTLARLGATVTCSDARAEHLAVAKVRFPDIKTVIADLDREWPSGVYDLTIHMGVLYHIRDYRSALRRACENCHKMVLETEVADSDDPSYELSTAEYGFDQAMNGVGVRPSATGIESVLKDCGLTYTRISDSRCNSGYHEYDWSVTNSGQWRHGLRRFWFAEKCASLPRSSARQ